MERHELPESHWLKLEPLLPGRPGSHGRAAKDNRNFLNAVLYLSKTGLAWRDLPDRFGKWDTAYHRFNQWCKKGVWQRLFEAVSRDADMEWLMMDSTVIRAHPHAAGMNGGADDEALGRSRGGFGTKIHLAVDALGNPVTITLSPGQDADISHAPDLLADHAPEKALADKGYDSDAFVKAIKEKGAEAVIPPKKNRKNPRDYDKDVYKKRNKVERTVGLLKQCRRVATRYEKTARNFLGIVLFAAINLWLK
ncbi:IS5 family transposase [Zavarzinella formosa]|uniref:IS5 family transposase n=1 Tax=Zavarzinella formosa TaxID=360055 RepID=UPI00037D6872|nr:IS5 family transposase [Zavarzinella formosa]